MDYSIDMSKDPSENIDCVADKHDTHVHVLTPERTLIDGALLFQALGSPERLQLMERLLD